MSKRKMKTSKWVFFSAFLMLGMMSFSWLQQGCTGNYPPIAAFVPPPFTATPTPTPFNNTYNFENNTAQGWTATGGNIPGVVMTLAAPGDITPLYCLNLYAPFTANNTSAGIVHTFPSIDLTGGGIQCEMWIDAGTVVGGFPGGQIFPSDGTNVSYSYYANLTQGAWTALSLSFPTSIYGGVNMSKVTSIIIQAATGGSGTVIPGNVKIDDIHIY